MLPSTGYFKGFNCPFYDGGLCERPYCHFRHVKKDSLMLQNEGIESGAMTEELQKLVSAVVQKVLQQKEAPVATSFSQPPVNECVSDVSQTVAVQSTSKATYNPTPLTELKKIIHKADEESRMEEEAAEHRRHIPVPYTPRKPTSLLIKRPADTNEFDSEPLTHIPPPLRYTPGCVKRSPLETYLPQGTTGSTLPYLQGNERELEDDAPIQTMITDKKNSSDKNTKRTVQRQRLEYNPKKVAPKHGNTAVKYQPTPKYQVPCFSSDEDEPKTKTMKLSNDLGNLDDWGPEFDMLDEILEEENCDSKTTTKTDSDQALQVDKNEDCKTDKSVSQHIDEKPVSKIRQKDNKHKSSSHSKERNSETVSDVKKSDHKERSSSHSKKRDGETVSKIKKDDNKVKDRSSSHSKDRNSENKSKKLKSKDHKSSHKEKSESKQKDDGKKHKHRNSDCSSKTSSKSSDKHSPRSKQSKPSSSKDSSNLFKSTSKHKTKTKHHKESKDHKDKHRKVELPIDNLSNSDNDFDNREPADEEMATTSESDEESRAMECQKIFEEYVPTAVPTNVPDVDNIKDDNNKAQYIPGKIRISRTTDNNIKVQQRAPIKPDFKLNAAQAMNDRLAKIREYHASRNHLPQNTNVSNHTSILEPVKTTPSFPNNNSNKVRIAHVPYASTLVNSKKSSTLAPEMKKDLSSNVTIVQTVKKGIQRTSHIPNEKFIDRPGVLEPLASKIPANIRSIYLNMMTDECLKIYTFPADAYARAQHEELNTSKKCSKVQVYKNSAVLAITRLRKEIQECNGIKKTGSECSALQSIPQTTFRQKNNANTWSIESKNQGVKSNSKEFKGAQLYKNISKWILTDEQLAENGFPMAHPNGQKGCAIIYGQKKQRPPKGNIRTCCRCKQDYSVDKRGFPAVKVECVYHPNNKYRYKGEAKYQCCGQDGMSDGCCAAPCHVWEYVDYENLMGFVTTMPPAREMDDYGVYALDCEMCYTTHGLDLTRVTVIDSACRVVYETFIKPIHPIVDYNTRYSGITEEQMANVKTTLLEVQASLLTMFNSKTILIGHSLESDFKALKLIHGTVIDTSVLFPHKMGLPFKRALRNLSSEYLRKIIQNSVDGHDSAEDATVCMELLIYKLKEDLKTN